MTINICFLYENIIQIKMIFRVIIFVFFIAVFCSASTSNASKNVINTKDIKMKTCEYFKINFKKY